MVLFDIGLDSGSTMAYVIYVLDALSTDWIGLFSFFSFFQKGMNKIFLKTFH